MTLDRIEAAARAMFDADEIDGEENGWDEQHPAFRESYRRRAAVAVTAAFPELAGDSPTAWLAPVEITDDMAAAMECAWGTEEQWTAARQAYLKDT